MVYEEASDALGWDVAAICNGEGERLRLTEFAQPCILTTEVAMFRELCDRHGPMGDYFGGHSLGEYAALTVAGALPLSLAVRTVYSRGRLMQGACPQGLGGMMAVLGDNLPVERFEEALSGLAVDVANVNSPGQVVLSGHSAAMDAARERLLPLGGGASWRFVPLDVSAPFHSRFMNPALDGFRQVLLENADAMNPARAGGTTSNFTGGFHEESREALVSALAGQFNSPVKWLANMRALAATGARVIEVGPGRPLRAFFKSLEIPCESITSLSQVRGFQK